MIRHIVLFKFHDGIGWDDPRARRAEQVTHGHRDEIPEILEWTVGRNTTDRDQAYDFAVVGLFEDRAALGRYLAHPDHRQGVELWRGISDWVVADLEGDAADAR